MAIIGKIRSKSSWIVGILGLALLAFTFDLWKDIFITGEGEDKEIGKVNDESINEFDYETYKRYVSQSYILNPQNEKHIAPQGRVVDMLNDQAWERFTDSIILSKECENLSMEVSENEIDAIVNGTMGFPGYPAYKQLENANDELSVRFFTILKNDIKYNQLKNKYLQLVSQGLYYSKLEIEDELNAKTREDKISFIKRNYNDFDDNRVSLSEKEIKAYYEKHKNEQQFLEKEDSRTISYVRIPVVPSSADTLLYENKMSEILRRWQTAKDDSIFVVRNSTNKFYSSDYRATAIKEGSKMAKFNANQTFRNKKIFENVSADSIVGPYYTDGLISIAKVQGFASSSMKIRRILFKTEGLDSTQRQTRLDSIKRDILPTINDENFTEMVSKYSEDIDVFKSNGGLLKLETQDKSFNTDQLTSSDLMNFLGMENKVADFCENAPVGKIDLTETMNSIEIIQVMERSEDKLPLLATISKSFNPSSKTTEKTKSDAASLIRSIQKKVNSAKVVDKRSVFKENLPIDLSNKLKDIRILNDNLSYTKAKDLYSYMDESGREIDFNSVTTKSFIKLAYNSQGVGYFNSKPISDGKSYIIAMVSSIKKKGPKSFDEVKRIAEIKAKNEKKGKIIASELVRYGSTLEDLKTKMDAAGIQYVIKENTVVNPGMSNTLPPKVLGLAYSGLKESEISLPIIADDGVYVLRVDSSNEKNKNSSFLQEKMILSMSRGYVYNLILESLRKKSGLEDNRMISK